jgi:PKD repeat protein
MKKILTKIIALTFLLLNLTTIAFAQDQLDNSNPEIFTQIQSTSFIEVNRPIIFTARPQFNLDSYKTVEFTWDFGDGNKDIGKEVAYNFREPGIFTVTLETIADEEVWLEQKEIFVVLKAAALISDQQKKINRIDLFLSSAEKNNAYLELIESFTAQSEFLSEEVLARKIIKKEDLISKLDTIAVWTQGSAGLNALSRAKQSIGNENLFNNTTIILIDEQLDRLSRVKRQFNQLKPKEIIVIEENLFFLYIESESISKFKEELENNKNYRFEIIDQQNVAVSKINVFSFFLDFLTEKGIPDNTIILILLLPVIATVIAFMKQVIGITTLGIYTPTIITLTFLTLGLEFGVLLLFFVITMGTLAHKIIKPLKLLYIPKMALILTSVSIILYLLLTLTVYLDLFDIEFISLAIFPVVIMGTLTEKFVTLRTEKGMSGSVLVMIETFFVSLAAYFVTGGTIDLYFFTIQWNFIRDLILNLPEVIILFIIVNIYLGRWTGLQLTEYIQFRDIINNSEE